jgi:hypothetical protein
MSDPFSGPASATGLDLKTLNGALLLFDVKEVAHDITTAFGPTDAVRADVAVLDGSQAGETFNDTLVFPKVLQSQLRPALGGKVLGRLGQGQAKPGQSAPWVLSDPTDADRQLGLQWLSRTTVAAPAPVASQPAAATAGAPPWAR